MERSGALARVIGIWASVLGVEGARADDDFLELGGESLQAFQLAGRIEREFEVAVPVADVFRLRTPARLAEVVAAGGERDRTLPERIEPASAPGATPLSPGQERLWMLDRIHPGTAAFNVPLLLRVRGDLAADAVAVGLRRIALRHEILRSAVVVVDGHAAQVVIPAEDFELPLPIDDLRAEPDAERLAGRLAQVEVRRPFDLAVGPLLRARLLRIADRDHMLAVTAHHIVSDAWSRRVLLRELAATYALAAGGRQPDLQPLPIQYADYAVWQRRRLEREGGRLLDHWRERLASAPTVLELATDRARPPVQSLRGETVEAALPATLVAALRAEARARGTTLYTILLAAYALLLSRQSGQDDLLVGTAVAGRSTVEVEPLIGFFVNTVPLRLRVPCGATFWELVRWVDHVRLDALVHQELPFELLLRELSPPRDPSRSALVQAYFNFRQPAEAEARLPGLEVTPVAVDERHALFDLSLYADDLGDGVVLRLVYASDLFDAARMREMVAQLQHLLVRANLDRDRAVGGLSLVTPGARLPDPGGVLGDRWEGPAHEVFAAHAQHAPDRPAIVTAGTVWTYGELDDVSRRLAARLAEAGAGPGEVVAISARRSPELVVSLVAVLRTGAAFLVLDPAYPPARLLQYVEQSGARVVVHLEGAGRLDAGLAGTAGRVVRVPVAGLAALRRLWPADPGPRTGSIGPDDPACVSFTSGSTGTPRGVLGRHGSLSHFIPWSASAFELDASDRYSMLAGLSHDPLQREVLTPLQLGAALAIPSPDEITPTRLAPWMAKSRVGVAHLSPALGQILTGVLEHDPGFRLPLLRLAFFVGDALTASDVDRLLALAPDVRVISYYGTTETQRAVGWAEVGGRGAPRAAPGRDVLPIGPGIEDVQVLVLSPSGQLAGVGELGEIVVRSPHVALGYLGDDDLTRSRFVRTGIGGGLDLAYRTGDLGRFRPDGLIDFAGRGDRQVKVRGYRVEPGEVEGALRAHPTVREALVRALPGPGGQQHLVGYVVPVKGASCSPDELRAHLAGRLPLHMVPGDLLLIDEIPLTPNMKVDTAALPRPPRSRASGPDTRARTELEASVAAVWREALGLDTVSLARSFFEQGGDSLSLLRVHSLLRTRLGLDLAVIDLFRFPDVRTLAAHLAGGGRAAVKPAAVGSRRAALRRSARHGSETGRGR